VTSPDTAGAVSYENDGGVLVVRMAHPPVNPLAIPLLDGLDRALDVFDGSAVRTMVLTSDVPRFFAAGADIKKMVEAEQDEFVAYGRKLRMVLERVARSDKPSVAAVEGRALGGGVELALVCTLRVASSAADFSLPEAQIGLIPSAGATQRLPRFVGRGRALDLLLTGRVVDAAEAQRIGLVDRLTEPGRAEAAAVALAHELSALSMPVLRDLIRGVDEAQEIPLADGLANEVRRVEQLFQGPDAKEGLRAFLERRPPVFS
jgi:enoyl-CoA hydratase/carnithine racemase